jgi:4-hydroxybenzoate polyprenyltransferase
VSESRAAVPDPGGAPSAPAHLPDARRDNWVDRLAPAPARPYLKLARIDRPIGWQLLFLPCLWSAALAALAEPPRHWGQVAWHLTLFAIGAIVMRGAGSTFNDIADRDLDAQVARTRHRPLPSGAVSRLQAGLFMIALSLAGFVVLLQFNPFAIWVGIGSLALVALYPFMKRITDLPQAVLGLTFAWGGLMGWAAAFGRLDAPALLIYAAAVAWTIGYDTIYALQDLEDDEVAGIKSSARLFGARTMEAVGLCYAAAFGFAFAAVWWVDGGLPAQAAAYAATLAFGAHLAWQVRAIPRARAPGAGPNLALRLFRSNNHAGLILGAGLLAAAILRTA